MSNVYISIVKQFTQSDHFSSSHAADKMELRSEKESPMSRGRRRSIFENHQDEGEISRDSPSNKTNRFAFKTSDQ